MHIGQISELSGYSQRMIRYLEDQGLLAPRRSDSNLRKFTDGDLTRILKIKRFKELGFTYTEIKELIDKDDNALATKGAELLKRHHAEAHDLHEKIQQLETLCYGQARVLRTAYRIKKFDAVYEHLKTHHPELKSEATLWKFREFLSMLDFKEDKDIAVAEIFRGSSQIVILEGENFLEDYEKSWRAHAMPFYTNFLGKFPQHELSEFFGSYEIIIEHKLLKESGEIAFHALLPYQAIFLASGEGLS